MKNTIFTLAVFIVFLNIAKFAYAVDSWGLTLGTNISDVYGDFAVGDEHETNAKLGFILGGYFAYKIHQGFSIQPEIFFSLKGFDYEARVWNIYSGNVFYRTYDKRYAYIDIPVLLKYSKPLADQFSTGIYFGPLISIFLHEFEREIRLPTNGDMTDFFNSGDINRFNFGLAAGVEIQYRRITIFPRYIIGLTNFCDNGELKHSVISIVLEIRP